jgi:exodeoxyribonuclease VII small subunit
VTTDTAEEREAKLDAEIAALPFDAAFAELRSAIEELEAGGLPLEATILRTERAVALQRHCERLLSDAELRVRQLTARPGGGLETREVSVDDSGEAG